MKKYQITLQWNKDHYDAYVPDIGEGVIATGKTEHETINNAMKAISKDIWVDNPQGIEVA